MLLPLPPLRFRASSGGVACIYVVGLEFTIIPMRIKSDRLHACSVLMMWAR